MVAISPRSLKFKNVHDQAGFGRLQFNHLSPFFLPSNALLPHFTICLPLYIWTVMLGLSWTCGEEIKYKGQTSGPSGQTSDSSMYHMPSFLFWNPNYGFQQWWEWSILDWKTVSWTLKDTDEPRIDFEVLTQNWICLDTSGIRNPIPAPIVR